MTGRLGREVSIDLIFEDGLEALTYEALSKRCGITRSLIYHYFPTTTDLLLFSTGDIRHRYQAFVLQNMASQTTMRDLLTAYIRYALLWVDHFPKDACVWLIFFHRCAVSPPLADHNRILVDMGIKRIEGLLLKGISSQEFTLRPEEVPQAARQIQLLISAGLIARATEKRTPEFWENEFQEILNLSLRLVSALQKS